MYQTSFWLLVTARGGWGVFRRASCLRFTPAVGQSFLFAEEEVSRLVQDVTWDEAEERFTVRLEDDVAPTDDWEEVQGYYLSTGWELQEDTPAVIGEGPAPPDVVLPDEVGGLPPPPAEGTGGNGEGR